MSAPAADESREPIDLLVDEFLQRVRKGESLTPEGFAKAHPDHAAELLDLLPTLLVLEQAKRERETEATGARRASVPMLARLGEFRIVREVGRGGMGVVFEAVQESLGRRVALKVLPQASLLSGNQLERFRREAQVAANLHHTHIVPVFGCGEADGYHYYAMQFIEGRGLDGVVRDLALRKDTLLPTAIDARARAAARIGEQVAEALHHAHQAGTLHRDVKPANLLLEQQGHVWVTDFGLAKALQYDGLTHSGDVLGTLQYLAPEQLDGIYDARSEVYALGLVLYELLALRPAFAAATRSELLDRIRRGAADALRRSCPEVPGDLATVLERAMAVEPARRYADAAQLAADLRAFLDDRPIAARRTSHLEHAWRWCRRNRGLAAATAVALGCVIGAAVVGWTFYLSADLARSDAEANRVEAQTASRRAEGNLTLALAAFEDVFDSLVGPDPLHAIVDDTDEDSGSVVAMRTPVDAEDLVVLQRMLSFYDRFAAQNADSPELREQTARAYRRTGSIQARLGNLEAAAAAYGKSVQLYRDVHRRGVTVELAGLRQEIGQVELRRGRPNDARRNFQDSIRDLENDVSESSRAARLLRARGHFLLATSYDLRGPGGGEGRGGRRGPQGAGEPGPGARRGGRGDLQREAVPNLRTARTLLDALHQESPEDPEVQFLEARVLLVGARPGFAADTATAAKERESALAILRALVERHPDNDVFRFELADALLPPPDADGDVRTLKEAVGHAERLVQMAPASTEYLALLGRLCALLGRQLRAAGEAGAEARLRQALTIEEGLRGKLNSPMPRFQDPAIVTRFELAQLLLDQLKTEEARGLLVVAANQLVNATERNGMPPRFLSDPQRRRLVLDVLERAGLGARAQQLRQLFERPPR